MIRCLIITCLCFNSWFSSAQRASWLYEEENFRGSGSRWEEVNNDSIQVKVIDNEEVYRITTTGLQNTYTVFNNVAFPWNENYRFETRVRQIAGEDDYGYGIVWGADKMSQYEMLKIHSSGYFQHVHRTGGRKTEGLRLYSKAIRSSQNWNDITIIRMEGLEIIVVNGDTLLQHKISPTYGSLIGFYVEKDVSIELDRVYIEHKKPSPEVYKPFESLVLTPIGEAINTSYDELSPVISPDGKTIYFLRKNDPGNFGGRFSDDIWYAERGQDSVWRKAINVGAPLNNEGHNFVLSSCREGKVLYLANTYLEDGTSGDAGISRTEFVDGRWELPKTVYIQDYYANTPFSSFFISADEQLMILGLDRDEGYGSRDLYLSRRINDTLWGEMLNLGSDINTAGKELSPFLAVDKSTLFFSSNGHPGYGSNDIFISKRLNSSWTSWSKPLNLGNAVNTSGWDAYLTIPEKCNELYIVREHGANGADIFAAPIYDGSILDPILKVSGVVKDVETGMALRAHIKVASLSSDSVVCLQNDPEKGFSMTTLYSNAYSVAAEKQGYFGTSKVIRVDSSTNFKDVFVELFLSPIKKGSTFHLNNIYFEQDKSDLLESSIPELRRLIALLHQHPKMKIKLEGHTERGSSDYLMELSERRVEAVKKYLVFNGVVASRIKTKGYGGTRPLSHGFGSNKSSDRRVAFKILKL